MAEYLIQDATLTAIADAIRAKLDSSETMLPGEMAGLIENISAGVSLETGTFKPSSDTTTVTLDIDLSDSDFLLVVFGNQYSGYMFRAYIYSHNGTTGKSAAVISTSNGSFSGTSATIVDLSSATFTIGKCKASQSYSWVLMWG